MDIKRVLASAPRDHDPGAARPLLTRWGEALDPETVRGEHPRPQFARDRFISLNGWWDYAFVPMGAHRTVRPPDAFDGRILVPFSPESLLSGVGRQLQPDELLWYVRRVPVPAMGEGERCLLHFEAVDFACACCVNGQVVGTHEGGPIWHLHVRTVRILTVFLPSFSRTLITAAARFGVHIWLALTTTSPVSGSVIVSAIYLPVNLSCSVSMVSLPSVKPSISMYGIVPLLSQQSVSRMIRSWDTSTRRLVR